MVYGGLVLVDLLLSGILAWRFCGSGYLLAMGCDFWLGNFVVARVLRLLCWFAGVLPSGLDFRLPELMFGGFAVYLVFVSEVVWF